MGVCKSCGKPLEDGAKFCPSCGATVTPEEQVKKQETVSETNGGRGEQTEKKKKPFFKTPLFIGLVILLLGGGVLAATLVLNKSPKESYLLSEYKTYEKAVEETKDRYGETLEFQDKMLENPSTSKLSLSGDVEMESAEGDPDFEMIREILQAAAITMEVNQDPEKKENHMKIGLNMEDESAIEAEIYQSDDQMGLSIPVLYDSFFYFNSKEYGELMRMIDPAYEGPEEFNMKQLEFEDLKLSEKEQEYLKETYVDFIYDNLHDDYFTEKKNVDYEHKGVKMELRELTLKMSKKETKQFLTNLIDQMIKDKELHDILVKRAKLVNEYAALAEEADPDTFDEKQLREDIVDTLKELKDGVKDLNFREGLTSKVLVDKDDYIVDRDMKVAIGDTWIAASSKDVPDDDKKRYQNATLEFTPYDEKDSEEKVTFSINNDIAYKNAGRTEDMKVALIMEGVDEGELSFSMKSDFDGENAKKQDVDRTFTLDFSSEDGSMSPTTIKGTIKQSNDVNAKDNYSKDKYKIEVELEDEYESGKLVLNIESDQKIKDEVKMPDLADGASGTTNLVDLTEEDFIGIYEEVVLNLMTIAETFGLDPYEMMGGSYYDDAYYDDGYYDEEAFDEYYDDSSEEIEEGATDL